MTEELFREPGKKIQEMAKIFFCVESVACVILAFFLGLDDFNALIFFGFLIGGPAGAYWSSLVLYGFGELVDKAGNTPQSVSRFGSTGKTAYEHKASSAEKNVKKQNPVIVQVPENKASADVKKEVPIRCDDSKLLENAAPIQCDDPNLIRCPSCGFSQDRKRNVCWNCGLKFGKDEPES